MADEPRTPETGEAGEAPTKESNPGSLAWLWMVLALVTVGGFLTWLGVASEPTSVAVVETDEEEEDFSIPLVPKDTLANDKAGYEGLRIRVHNVEATSSLGPRIFWGELGDLTQQVPLLVRLDSAAAEGFTMESGGLYTLTGELHPMTDSLATVWGEAGEFAGEGEQMQAAFTDYYMQVERIRPTPRSALESRGQRGSGQSGQNQSGATGDTASSG